MSLPLEHDYIGLSEKIVSCCEEEEDDKKNVLNLKRTELRLGLPGSESPERSAGLEDKNGFSLRVLKSLVSGAKRGFDDSANWGFSGNGGGKPLLDNNNKNGVPPSSSNVKSLPAKSQVVGWPPIRSFRKNTMAAAAPPKNHQDKSVPECLYVKVSMDGAPYLRKLDLKTYSNYMELSAALDKMFSSFTIGQCGSHGVQDKDGVTESRLKDLLHASECALTYEDKDGDWMLVGDVPWDMFINSCKRLRIMKGSEAIGLAPRPGAMGKCRNMN